MSHLQLIDQYKAANKKLLEAVETSDEVSIANFDEMVSTQFDNILVSVPSCPNDAIEFVDFLLGTLVPTEEETTITKNTKDKIALLVRQCAEFPTSSTGMRKQLV